MESAYALDRGDSAFRNDPAGPCDRFTSPDRFLSGKIYLRSALIAANRLGIVSSALWGVILAVTSRAHREHLHARSDPVIGEPFQDREPGSAARAVDKGVEIPSVFRIE